MSVSYWQNTVGFGDGLNTDVLIIGAGIAGLSAAYWLHKQDPNLSLAVIDKGDVGAGASGRNAGFITCGSTEYFSRMISAYGEDKANQIWKFTEDNHRMLLTEFGADHLERRCDYKQRGSWTLATTEHEAETIRDSLKDLKERGVQADWYGANYVEERLQCEGFVGGAKYPKDGEVHPIKLLYHIASFLKGVPIIENREVFRVDEKNGRLLVTGRNIEIVADSIVLATNAYSGQLFSYFEDKIYPTRGQIIVTSPVPQFLEPCYCSFALDYFRQLPDGRVLIGGFRNTDMEKEVGFSDEINSKVHENLEGFLQEHFPPLRKASIEYRWSGVMGFSKDHCPLVGSLPQDPRIFFAAGFTGHGLGYAFKMGKVLSDLMLEGKDPGIFAARRFQ